MTPAFDDFLCCPSCHGQLGNSRCSSCGRPFQRVARQVRFINSPVDSIDAAFQAETQNRSSFTGRLFAVGKALISSEFQPCNYLMEFLTSVRGTVVELGAGSRRLRADVITVDLFSSANIDIVADISETPLRDASIDCVILDSVIEHVSDPQVVVAEAYRILRPGGRLFINCPFMMPYHGYPKHFQNFTRDGLQHLLRNFRDVVVRSNFGPMTAWVNMTAELFAVVAAGERGLAYVIAKGAALLPIFWLKYLDALIVRAERSHRIAGMLNAVAKK
jgi:SAM-dependent methyltransferase